MTLESISPSVLLGGDGPVGPPLAIARLGEIDMTDGRRIWQDRRTALMAVGRRAERIRRQMSEDDGPGGEEQAVGASHGEVQGPPEVSGGYLGPGDVLDQVGR